MKGKEKCKILKDIRRQIAENNDIEFVTSECKHKGDCLGTCPKCEAELRYLERELEKRQKLGKAVTLAGLAVTITASATACDVFPVQGNMQVDGELLPPPSVSDSSTLAPLKGATEPLMGDTSIVTEMGEIFIPTFDYVIELSEESALISLSYMPIDELIFYWDDSDDNISVVHDENEGCYIFIKSNDEIHVSYDKESNKITRVEIFRNPVLDGDIAPSLEFCDFTEIFDLYGTDKEVLLFMATQNTYTSYMKLWNEYITEVSDDFCIYMSKSGGIKLFEGENNMVADLEIIPAIEE